MNYHTRSIHRAGLVLLALSALGGATAAVGQSSSVNGVAVNVLIASLGMTTTNGSMVFISISSNTGGYKTGNPTCSTNGAGQWVFVLPLNTALQNQMFTALLAAHNAGAPVTLVGSGKCDTFSTVETLADIIV
jgi:hypothetical protein